MLLYTANSFFFLATYWFRGWQIYTIVILNYSCSNPWEFMVAIDGWRGQKLWQLVDYQVLGER